MTRVALYLFTFSAVNRYYTVCLKSDEKGFFGFKRTKFALLLLVIASLAEMVLQAYTACYDYDQIGVLFIKSQADETSKSWELTLVTICNWLNWILLIIITFVISYLYIAINKYENIAQNRDAPDFRFDEPEYDQFYERKVTKMFKWSTVFALLFLYPQVIIQAICYYYSGDGKLSKEATLMLTIITDFINLWMFILTPSVYFAVNVQFRTEVKILWRDKIWLTSILYRWAKRKPSMLMVNAEDNEQDHFHGH